MRGKLVQLIDNLRYLNATQMAMTNEGARRDVIGGPKSQMDLVPVEDWRPPSGPMPECNWMVGIVECSVTYLHQCIDLFPD
jgi:hypothetical protein